MPGVSYFKTNKLAVADYIPEVITVLHKLAAKIMSYINCDYNIVSQLSFMKGAFK